MFFVFFLQCVIAFHFYRMNKWISIYNNNQSISVDNFFIKQIIFYKHKTHSPIALAILVLRWLLLLLFSFVWFQTTKRNPNNSIDHLAGQSRLVSLFATFFRALNTNFFCLVAFVALFDLTLEWEMWLGSHDKLLPLTTIYNEKSPSGTKKCDNNNRIIFTHLQSRCWPTSNQTDQSVRFYVRFKWINEHDDVEREGVKKFNLKRKYLLFVSRQIQECSENSGICNIEIWILVIIDRIAF